MSRALLALGGCALGLLIAEAALRLDGGRAIPGGYRLDRELGWLEAPRAGGEDARPAGGIVILGDSFTAPRRGLAAKLQEAFRRRGRPRPILNMSVPGYGTVQELGIWRRLAPASPPEAVVLAVFLWNDLPDNLNDIYYNCLMAHNRPSARESPAGISLLRHDLFLHLRARLSELSHVARLVHERELRSRSRRGEIRLFLDPESWAPFYRSPPDPRAAEGFRVMEDLLRRLDEDVRSRGSRLVVAAFDNAFRVEGDFGDELRRREPSFARLDTGRPMREIEAMARRARIDFLDLDAVFLDHKRRRPSSRLYEPALTGHFTELGEQVAAEALADFLE